MLESKIMVQKDTYFLIISKFKTLNALKKLFLIEVRKVPKRCHVLFEWPLGTDCIKDLDKLKLFDFRLEPIFTAAQAASKKYYSFHKWPKVIHK